MGFFDRNRRHLVKLGYEPERLDGDDGYGDLWRGQRYREERP